MTFNLRVEKLVFGGDGLGHHQGRTVMIPRVVPGELVEAEEIQTAKGVTHARPLRVLEPAAERVEAPCPYFGKCGGCQYQHVRDDLQPERKREILRETLRRIGKITWDREIEIHAAHPWNYRNQAQFKVSRTGGGLEIGYYEAESHRLVAIDECKILSPRLNEILRALRREDVCEYLRPAREIELRADDRDEKVMLTLDGEFDPAGAGSAARSLLGRLPGVASVAIPRDGRFEVFGDSALTYQVGEFRYRVSPGSFFQAARHLLADFVRTATGDEKGSLALDLFAGVGLFTLPLARAFGRVLGVEGNRRASADLAANARDHHLDNIQVASESIYDFLRRFARAGPDLAVLDPPRAGVGEQSLALLAKLRPARLHYVSCHPPTLARDLAHLARLGYAIISIAMFDLFPQTAHIECVAKLTRSGHAGS
ncbi:MAG TPA: class I SAM-dependent RNA methyltransferase [Terriglobia bacterium]|nr:class I SAM-dependent RNA methyltransferase [Terriglobia bacterium]